MQQQTSASPLLRSPSPVNVTLQQLGRGVDVWGERRGRMPGFDLPGQCQESPKQKTTNVCLSLIYADEPVVILSPPAYLSLVPSVVG